MVAASSHDFGKTIVDSGTTLTYIPRQMFSRLTMNIETFCGTHRSCHAEKDETNENCWRMNDPNGSPDGFPSLQLSFDDSVTIPWKPTSYMSERGYGIWCLAIAASSNHDTILGISWMLHRDTIFDMGSRQIGMAAAKCPSHEKVPTTLWEKLAHITASFRHPSSATPWSLLSLLVMVTMVTAGVALSRSRHVAPQWLSEPGRPSDTHALLEC